MIFLAVRAYTAIVRAIERKHVVGETQTMLSPLLFGPLCEMAS